MAQLHNTKQITFLLGAGFSAPMGYPVGKSMNNRILNLEGCKISFMHDGQLIVLPAATTAYFDCENNYQRAFSFLKRIINRYNLRTGDFDYELFFDFLTAGLRNDEEYKRMFSNYYSSTDYQWNRFLSDIEVIYNLTVAFFIKDCKGRQRYDNGESLTSDDLQKYQNFSQILNLLSADHILHLHSLNHDLLLEALGKTPLLHRSLSDGFSSLNSHYGSIRRLDGRSEVVALEEYTGDYYSNLGLYKMHGSLDYWLFCIMSDFDAKPERMLKLGNGTSPIDMFKTDPETGERKRWPFEYAPSVLTGTTSKMKQYKKFFFNELFRHFENNLRNSKMLVIIGYGFKDQGINDMIEKCFDYENKPVIVIDPYIETNDAAKRMCKKLHAKMVAKSIEDVDLNDLNM